jgi:hypothetical protein
MSIKLSTSIVKIRQIKIFESIINSAQWHTDRICAVSAESICIRTTDQYLPISGNWLSGFQCERATTVISVEPSVLVVVAQAGNRFKSSLKNNVDTHGGKSH